MKPTNTPPTDSPDGSNDDRDDWPDQNAPGDDRDQNDDGDGQGGGNGPGQDDADNDDDTGQDDDGDGQGKDQDRSRRTRDRRTRGGDDKSARTIAAIREEFKGERGKRQQAEARQQQAEKGQAALQKQIDELQGAQAKQMDALAKALGLKKDDTPPSPEQVAKDFGKKLEAANGETETERQRADTAHESYRTTAVQLAVYLAADDHDGNPRALLDSARFLRSVAGLDPDADDFADKIADAIDKAVEKNDRLRKAKPRGADRSGGEMNTGAKPQRRRPASMSEAINKHYAS